MGDVVVEAVWPPPGDGTKVWECNDTSMVLRVTYQDRPILLPGDISQAAMAEMLAGGGLKADVLELPHHGSVVHNTARFVEAVNPAVAVRSSGERRGMTVNGIERIVGNRKYFNTADDGCVLVWVAGGQVTANPVMDSR